MYKAVESVSDLLTFQGSDSDEDMQILQANGAEELVSHSLV